VERGQPELDLVGHGVAARRPHDHDRESCSAVGFVELEGAVGAGLLRRRFDPRRVGRLVGDQCTGIPQSRSR
jgi:hypothetical protein